MRTSERILKSHDVELDGRYQLGLAPGNYETPGAVLTSNATVEPQARIIEKQPGYAVIEVTCSCGTKVCLKCEYSNGELLESS